MNSYDDAIGWTCVPGVLTPAQVAEIVSQCDALMASDDFEARPGDKPVAGTQRLARIDRRIAGAAGLPEHPAIVEVVEQILDGRYRSSECTYRSPGPGRGHQQLHADEMPRLDVDGPYLAATALVALVDFTADNGAIRLVGGTHLRPDLQRDPAEAEADGRVHPVAVEMPAGSAVVFNGHLLHAGSQNRSNRPRPAIQVVYRLGPPGPMDQS